MKFQLNESQTHKNRRRTKKFEYVETSPFPTADINEKASASPVLFFITGLLFYETGKTGSPKAHA